MAPDMISTVRRFTSTHRARLTSILTLALLLPLLCGCLKTFQLVLKPKADGSGTLDYTIVLKEETVAMMKESQSSTDSGSTENRSIDAQMHRVADSSKGVLSYVRSSMIIRHGDTVGATATFHYDDISKLHPQELFRSPSIGAQSEDDSTAAMWTSFEMVKGTPSILRVTSRKPEEFIGFSGVLSTQKPGGRSKKLSQQEKHMDNPFATMVAEMLDSLEMNLSIEPQGQIVSTNATHRTNSSLVFAHADLTGLKALTALRTKNPTKAAKLEKAMLSRMVVEKTPVVEIRFND